MGTNREPRPTDAVVTVTVKLTAEQVAWLDGEVASLRRTGEHWHRYRIGAPTRSGVVRGLVDRAAREAAPLFNQPASSSKTRRATRRQKG